MTGFEYAAGVLMLQEGLTREGLTVIRDIRERYDGRKRNPWNEAECGHHYARAMAAWAGLLTLSGFQYSALEREVQFLPRVRTSRFQCFWSVDGAWGTVSLDANAGRAELCVLHGKLKLKALRLPAKFAGAASARVNGKSVKVAGQRDGEAAVLRLGRAVTVTAGKALLVR